MGSKLISKQLMADKDYAKIESETVAVLRIINSIK
jgi:2-dehydro-3-deoxyphosphogluconate aldolase/(4S)-4-hydroxy-2-oxoglutarate aldolase